MAILASPAVRVGILLLPFVGNYVFSGIKVTLKKYIDLKEVTLYLNSVREPANQTY